MYALVMCVCVYIYTRIYVCVYVYMYQYIYLHFQFTNIWHIEFDCNMHAYINVYAHIYVTHMIWNVCICIHIRKAFIWHVLLSIVGNLIFHTTTHHNLVLFLWHTCHMKFDCNIHACMKFDCNIHACIYVYAHICVTHMIWNVCICIYIRTCHAVFKHTPKDESIFGAVSLSHCVAYIHVMTHTRAHTKKSLSLELTSCIITWQIYKLCIQVMTMGWLRSVGSIKL